MAACKGMAFLCLTLDLKKIAVSLVDEDIAAAKSEVRTSVVHTQEDWVIAQKCIRVEKQN